MSTAVVALPLDWIVVRARVALGARPPSPPVKDTFVATTNDLKNGMTLDLDGQLWNVVEFQHVKPGKGPAFVRTKLKHVLTGKTWTRRSTPV